MEGDEYASGSDDDGGQRREGGDGETLTAEAEGVAGSKKRKKEQSRRVCFGSRNGRSKQTDCDFVYANQTATTRPATHKNGLGLGVVAAVTASGGESSVSHPPGAVNVASATMTKPVTELTIRIPCTLAEVPTTEKDGEKVTKEDREGVEEEDDGDAAGQSQNKKKKRCGCRIGRGARAIVRLNANNGEILEKYCRFVHFDAHSLDYICWLLCIRLQAASSRIGPRLLVLSYLTKKQLFII